MTILQTVRGLCRYRVESRRLEGKAKGCTVLEGKEALKLIVVDSGGGWQKMR